MGAVEIFGEFSSSNWEESIRKLQQEATRYCRLPDGSYVEDEECFYDGTIYSIDTWDMIKMHNSTPKEINQYLDSQLDNIDKCAGLVIEGQQVGYDIYRPTFEKIDQSIPGYTRYFENKLYGCVLLEQVHTRSGNKVEVIKRGSLEECKDYAANKLYVYLNNVYIICSSTGKIIKCYNKVRRVKETTQKSEWGKLEIEPVYNYYWTGWAAT